MSAQLPPCLFLYRAFDELTKKGLQKSTIWLADPLSFNDPFDCSLLHVIRAGLGPNWESQKKSLDLVPGKSVLKGLPQRRTEHVHEVQRRVSALEQLLKQGRYPGIRSVSGPSAAPGDPLMWSHYADQHRGICLMFNQTREPFCDALEVNYVENLLDMNDLGSDDDLVVELARRKSIAWRREHEWRIVRPALASTEEGYPQDALLAVYVGCRFPDTEIPELESLLPIGCPVLRMNPDHQRADFFPAPSATDRRLQTETEKSIQLTLVLWSYDPGNAP